jgi:tetratricopeptide (TPR) repeat protein
MQVLPISEQFHIEAAKGWILLSDRKEAYRELDHINRQWRKHPEVLELRWYLLAEEEKWEEAFAIAEKINEQYPDRLFGWLAHAHSCLKFTGDAESAWEILLPAHDLFDGPQIAYGLACYASLAGRLDDAREWLEEAVERAGSGEFENVADQQIDFKALSEFIDKL